MDLSRRTLLTAAGLVAATPSAAAAGVRSARAASRPVATVRLAGTALGTGRYLYHPFTVPPGVNRLDVRIDKQGGAKTGLGLFDERGSHYATLERPNGFRGIYGEERGAFFVATDAASPSFTPGPVHPGTWTVVVPVFQAPQPTPYTVTVEMRAEPAGAPFRLGPEVGTVLDEPGWYRGDLHAHTPESSDAASSGSAMTPAEWAEACRRIGLDFLALTDHNVVTQNHDLARAAGEDMLLMPGEEMTNWFHGHATVSGISPGDWFDWRQLPVGAAGNRLDPRSGSVQEFLRAARHAGAFVSAAHPFGATLAWRFFPEAAADPAARTDSLEVWTGPFQPDDQASVDAWDAMNRQGQHIVANGGSDLHGVRNDGGSLPGLPTTVVHAQALSKHAVVAALRAGRSFVTRRPDGVEVYVSASLPGQRQIVGGTVYGAPGDAVTVQVRVRRAGGMRLVVLRDGAPVQATPLTSDDQTVELVTPVGTGGFVRAEVRSRPTLVPGNPAASTLDMEALTNPVWIAVGEPPAGLRPDLTQPPTRPGPRRQGPPGAGHPAPVPGGAPAPPPPAGSAPPRPSSGGRPRPHEDPHHPRRGRTRRRSGHRRRRGHGAQHGQHGHGVQHGQHGHGAQHGHGHAGQHGDGGRHVTGAAVAAAGVAGAAVTGRMSLREFLFRAAAALPPEGPVTLTGQLALDENGQPRVRRWVDGCCATQAPVDVALVGAGDLVEGRWYAVTGRAEGGTLVVARVAEVPEPASGADDEPTA